CMGIVFLFVIIMLLYVRNRILAPFDSISNLPEELAKGNITVPLKAQKSGFFGRFIWGLDLLRERLEKGRQQDLETQKNNKSLILSLSHDIKTPLSIIELNSKALERGLYENNKEKKERIAGVINEKCGEIKSYVDQIIQASKEDFLELEVNNREFYLAEIMNSIKTVYADKMELLQIEFKIDEYSDCMLKGDPDRAVEVMQNLLENAVKYGDGQKIEISFAREENSQLISVANTGCTLGDEELPHIFDSFWRGSNTGSNTGSGLGLYICRQIMNRMGGEVFAEIKDGMMIITAVFNMA
nr:HAMP domain-containing histidine kinase [Lachnospiraceae bacterium]